MRSLWWSRKSGGRDEQDKQSVTNLLCLVSPGTANSFCISRYCLALSTGSGVGQENVESLLSDGHLLAALQPKKINEEARDGGSVVTACSLTAFAPFGLEVWTDERGWSMGVNTTGRCQRDVGLCVVLGRSKMSRVKRTRERGQDTQV